ncbi:hypothetical protein B0O99DRAFT_680104 [Bisporella sp. PMI_857]|nr:hypothetical protein B0O99DRAFT_680104 [Bisporella sp. PMI_857]
MAANEKNTANADVQEIDVDKPEFEDRGRHVLQACEAGQISALQLVLASAGIVPPAQEINVHNETLHLLPHTHQMVEAAIRGRRCDTVEHIYKTFPRARLHGPELIAAIEVGDLDIFKLLHKQSHSKYDFILHEFPDQETTLTKTCRGSSPDLALYLLTHGADPNYSGTAGELGAVYGPLANAVPENEVTLVEQLIERGAVVEEVHLLLAVEKRRADVLKVLVSRVKEEEDIEAAVMKCREVDWKEGEGILVGRIMGEDKNEEEEEGMHLRWHRIKEHFMEKVHVASH